MDQYKTEELTIHGRTHLLGFSKDGDKFLVHQLDMKIRSGMGYEKLNFVYWEGETEEAALERAKAELSR